MPIKKGGNDLASAADISGFVFAGGDKIVLVKAIAEAPMFKVVVEEHCEVTEHTSGQQFHDMLETSCVTFSLRDDLSKRVVDTLFTKAWPWGARFRTRGDGSLEDSVENEGAHARF